MALIEQVLKRLVNTIVEIKPYLDQHELEELRKLYKIVDDNNDIESMSTFEEKVNEYHAKADRRQYIRLVRSSADEFHSIKDPDSKID